MDGDVRAGSALAEVWAITSGEYFADCDHQSKSMIADFAESRRYYRDRYVTKIEPARKPTAEMRLGTILHGMVLGTGANFATPPNVNWRTNAGKDEFSAWAQAACGVAIPADVDKKESMVQYVYDHAKVVVATQEELAEANRLFESLMASTLARPYLEAEGFREQPIRWQHGKSGLACKGMLDLVIPDMDCVIDLKTSQTCLPDDFSAAAYNFAYHWQAHHYLCGAKEVYGFEGRFFFVVVSKKHYEVAVYELDQEAIKLAGTQVDKKLDEIAECIETDNWISPHCQREMAIGLPRYSRYASEWEL